MNIMIVKFGDMLLSRLIGREAALVFKTREIPKQGEITLDFAGVKVLTPSWADEFIAPLLSQYPNRVEFINTDNLSVKYTLDFLSQHVWNVSGD